MIEKYKLYYRTFLVLFWGAMCWGFVTEEILTPLVKGRNAFFLILDVVLFVLGICLLRTKKDLAVLLSFSGLAILSTIILNHLSPLTMLNGARDFLGLLFVFPILSFFLTGERAAEFKQKIDRQLFIWMCIQAFCITWQFVKYGANDHGGGSMGYGASGMVSMLLYVTSYYLTIQNWDFNDYAASIKRNKWNLLLILPTFLNETKISFILLAIYILLLYRPTKASLIKMAYVVPVFIVIFSGIVTVYMNATNQDKDEVFSSEYLYEYLMGEDIDYYVDLAMRLQDGEFDDSMTYPGTYWAMDIQRFAKIYLVIEPESKTGGGLVFGAGLGQFKGGTTLEATPFARKYKWLLQGTRPWVFMLLVQLGFMGIAWFIWMIVINFRGIKNMNFAKKRTMLLIASCLIIIFVYNDSLRYYYMCIGLFYPLLALRLFKADET